MMMIVYFFLFFVFSVIINVVISILILTRTHSSRKMIKEAEALIHDLMRNVNQATHEQIVIAEEVVGELKILIDVGKQKVKQQSHKKMSTVKIFFHNTDVIDVDSNVFISTEYSTVIAQAQEMLHKNYSKMDIIRALKISETELSLMQGQFH